MLNHPYRAEHPRRQPCRHLTTYDDIFRPEGAIVAKGPVMIQPSKLAYRDDARGLYLYYGDCLEVMDTQLVRYPQGVFDKRIFPLRCFELDRQSCESGRVICALSSGATKDA